MFPNQFSGTSASGRAMKRRGRPPSGRKLAPPRQIGRVPEDVWLSLVAHVRARGETFTAWALRHLLRAKKRETERQD